MKLEIDPADLRPLVETVVEQVVARMYAARAQLGDRLVIPEAEAAALLSMKAHQLRDARLRGEVEGVLMGKRVMYRREDLLEMIQRNRIR